MAPAGATTAECRHALGAVAPHALECLKFSASKPNADDQYPLPTAPSSRLASLHTDLGTHAIAELHEATIADSELCLGRDCLACWGRCIEGSDETPRHYFRPNTVSHSSFTFRSSKFPTHAYIDSYLCKKLRGHVFCDSARFCNGFLLPSTAVSRMFDNPAEHKRWKR